MGEIYSKPEDAEGVQNSSNSHEPGDAMQQNYAYMNGSHPSASAISSSQLHSSQRSTPGRTGVVGPGNASGPPQHTRPNVNGASPVTTHAVGSGLNSSDYASRFYLPRNANTLQDSRGSSSQIPSSHIGVSPSTTPTTNSTPSNMAARPPPSHISLPAGYVSTLPHSHTVLRRPQLINEQQPHMSQAISHSQLLHSQQQTSSQGKRPRLASGGGYPNEVDDQQFTHQMPLSASAAAPSYMGSSSVRYDRLSNTLPAPASPKVSAISGNPPYHPSMSGITRVITSSINPEHLVAGPSGYQPQVEAISPAPEDVRLDVTLIREKEEISTKLVQVEKEITHHEESKRRLLQKQEQLMERIAHRQAAHERGTDTTSTSHGVSRSNNASTSNGINGEGTQSGEESDDILLKPKSYSNPIQEVLNENRQKSRETHENLLRLCGFLPSQRSSNVGMASSSYFPNGLSLLDAPLYRQPSDLDCLKEEIKYYEEDFKPRLVQYIRKRRMAEKARLIKLGDQYEAQAKIWCKKVDKVNNSTKRRQKEARMREQFERVFPEIRKNREEREKAILAAEELAAAATAPTGSGGTTIPTSISTNVHSSHSANCSSAAILSNSEERYSTRGAISNYNSNNNGSGSGDDEIIPYDPVKERQRLREQAVEPPITIPPWDRKFQIVLMNGLLKDPKAQHRQDLDTISYWSPDEDTIFRRCYIHFTKNFHQYTPYLPRKRIHDMVQYYYLTKGRAQYKNLLKKQNRRKGRSVLPLSIPNPNIHSVTAYPCGVSLGTSLSRFPALGASNVEPSDGEGPMVIDSATVEVEVAMKKEFAPVESSCAEDEMEAPHVKPITPLTIFNPLHEEVSSAEEEEDRPASPPLEGEEVKVVPVDEEQVVPDRFEGDFLPNIYADKARSSGSAEEPRSMLDIASQHSMEPSTCIKDIIHMVIDRTLHRSWKDNPSVEEKLEEERSTSANSSGRPPIPAARPGNNITKPASSPSNSAVSNMIDVVRALTPTTVHQPQHYPIPQSLSSHLHRYQSGLNSMTAESAGLSLSPGIAAIPKGNPQNLGLLHPHSQLPSTVVPAVVPSAAAHFYRTHPFMSHHQQALLQQHHISGSGAHPQGCMPLAGANPLSVGPHGIQGIAPTSGAGDVIPGSSLPMGMIPSAHHLTMRQNFPESISMNPSQTAIVYPHPLSSGLSAVPLPSFLPVSASASGGTLQRPPLTRLAAPFILPPNQSGSSLPSPGGSNTIPGYPHSIHSISSSLANNLGPSGVIMPPSSLSAATSVERPGSGTTHLQENSNKAILDCDFLTAQEIVSPVMSVSSSSISHPTVSYPNKMSLSKPPSIMGREDQRHNPIPPSLPSLPLKLSCGVNGPQGSGNTGSDRTGSQNRSGAINPNDLPSVKSIRGMAVGRNSPHYGAPCDIQPPEGDADADNSHTRQFSSDVHRMYMEQMSSLPFRSRSDSQRTRTSSEASQCVKAAELMRRKISQLQSESHLEQEPEQHQVIQQPAEMSRNKPSPHNKEDMPPPLANYSVGRFRMGTTLDRSGNTGTSGIIESGPNPILSPSAADADPPRRQGISLSGPEAFRKRGYTDSGLNLRSPSGLPEAHSARPTGETSSGNPPQHHLSGTQTSAARVTKNVGPIPKGMPSTSTTAALVMAAALADSEKLPTADPSSLDCLQSAYGMTTASIINAMIDKHITDGDNDAEPVPNSHEDSRKEASFRERSPVAFPPRHLKRPPYTTGGIPYPKKGESDHSQLLTIGYQIEKYIEQETNSSPPTIHNNEPTSHMMTPSSSPFPKRRILNSLYEAGYRDESTNEGKPSSSSGFGEKVSYPPVIMYKSPYSKGMQSSSRKEDSNASVAAYASQSPTSRGHSVAYHGEDFPSGIQNDICPKPDIIFPKSPKQPSPRASASPLVVTSSSPARVEYSKKSTPSPKMYKGPRGQPSEGEYESHQQPLQASPPSPMITSNIVNSVIIPTPSPPTQRESHIPPKKRALLPPPLPSPVALSSAGSSPFREGDLQIDIESTASQDEGQDNFLTHMSD